MIWNEVLFFMTCVCAVSLCRVGKEKTPVFVVTSVSIIYCILRQIQLHISVFTFPQ